LVAKIRRPKGKGGSKPRKERVIEIPPTEKSVSENINHSAVFAELALQDERKAAEELKLAARAFTPGKRKKDKKAGETENGHSSDHKPAAELLNSDDYFPSQVLFG
jgi:hypothetical protein